MKVSLHDIVCVARAAGWPADRKRVKQKLGLLGIQPERGEVRKGQIGNLYSLDRLPRELQEPLHEFRDRSSESNCHPHPVSADAAQADRYLHAAPSLRKKAERARDISWHIRVEAHRGVSLKRAYAAAAERFGVSKDTATRHWKTVRNLPEDQWLDALVPGHKGRAKAAIDERILAAFVSDYGRLEQPQAQACYDRLCHRARVNDWGTVPPLKTLQRRWNDISPDVRKLLREGERSLLDSLPHQERDRSGMRPMDSWNMDSRTYDVFVQLDDGRVIRPVVSKAQDEATNFLVGYEVTETETGASYRRVLCDAFGRHGLPGKVRFDNTLAAANKTTTAHASLRYRFKESADDIEGLLPRLGIEVAFTQPYNGRAKLVERAHCDIKERVEKDPRLAGAYTGRSPVEKPANYGSRAVPLSLFIQVLAEGVEEYNGRTGRRSQVGPCYQDAFMAGLRDRPVRRLTEAQRRLFFLAAERRTVTPAGTVTIKLKGERFGHRYGFITESDVLRDHVGQDVVVRYDENDMAAPIVVEALDGRLIADAVPRIEAGDFNSAEAAGAHGRARKQVRRGAKLQADAYRRMDELESGKTTPVAAGPAPEDASSVKIVQPTFRKRPRAVAPPAVDADPPAKPVNLRELNTFLETARSLRQEVA